jgi:UDP-glucose 4-epimerase
MSILITGGAGYIGSHACVELMQSGYEVVVVDNLSNSKEESLTRVQEITGKPLKFYKVDLLDKDNLDEIFNKEQIEAVIHFAGLKAVGESVSIPYKYYHNNITGTLNLCDIMQKHGVTDLVFSSSATVYGDPHAVPITEEFPEICGIGIINMTKPVWLRFNEFSLEIKIIRYFVKVPSACCAHFVASHKSFG